MVGIRGAITVENDIKEEVLIAVRTLLCKMIEENNIKYDDIISIIFTCTEDINSVYPAQAARELGIVYAGLLCFNEMNVVGSLRYCIRVLILANIDIPQKDVNHIYLGGASILRPDLIKKIY